VSATGRGFIFCPLGLALTEDARKILFSGAGALPWPRLLSRPYLATEELPSPFQ